MYLDALAAEGAGALTGFAWPSRELGVRVTARVVWGVPVADLEAAGPIVRTLAARGLPPGAVPAAVEAAEAFERLTDLLVRAAPREMLLRRLGEALSQTTRQVNRLERRVAPGLRRQASRVRSALDEREREEHVRLGLVAPHPAPIGADNRIQRQMSGGRSFLWRERRFGESPPAASRRGFRRWTACARARSNGRHRQRGRRCRRRGAWLKRLLVPLRTEMNRSEE